MNVGMKVQTTEFTMTIMCCCYSVFIPMNMALFSMHMKS